MSLEKSIMPKLKEAMKAKDKEALNALRAIKSEVLLAKTSGTDAELSEADEVKLLQKLVKQRNEAAEMYNGEGRADLAEPELLQIEVIKQFLPAQLSEAEVKAILVTIVAETGASSVKDMGKVMAAAQKKLAGSADGKLISSLVKEILA